MPKRPADRPADRPPFDLRIDDLILHGFRPADRHAIAAAIERELVRLLSAGDLPTALIDGRAAGRAAYRLDAGSFVVPHDAPPDAVGVQVARAIHRGLGGGADSRPSITEPGGNPPTGSGGRGG